MPSQEIKEAARQATVGAIGMEIRRNQKWLEVARTDGSEITPYEDSLKQLRSDEALYAKMSAETYVLTTAETLDKAWVDGPASDNTVLHFEGMSRSGPWYHLAGVHGGYALLQPKQHYAVTYHRVYSRSYGPMDSAYVFLAQMKPSTE